ncbi:MAG: chromate efflux transporter [Pseudomonadota bacterium]
MQQPSLTEAARVWAKIGVLSFGGPAGQIALMHREVVEGRGWLSEQQFLNAISFCMLLPGPEAMQIATYAGWRLHGVLGGLIAGLLFILPGALVMLTLAAGYASYGALPLAQTVFLGIKATVIVIVLQALLGVSRRALKTKDSWVLAGVAFLAIFVLGVPFPLIVLAAAVYGFLRQSQVSPEPVALSVPASQTAGTVALWLAIWLLPLAVLSAVASETILVDIGVFFSKLAVVTFGGAYAVLAYMAQDVVTEFSWLTAGEMMDGLGLAETTPGPLILVTQFVGYLAAEKAVGLGLAAAAITLWVTFTPCFLWIFAGAPYIDWISSQPRLAGALSAITAAVVGVILNLSVWFALHVLFAKVSRVDGAFWQLWLPDVTTLDWRACVLVVLSVLLLWRMKWNLLVVLFASASFGAILAGFGG